jgi:hypothetical protein
MCQEKPDFSKLKGNKIMKYSLLLAGLVAAVALSACEKQPVVVNNPVPAPQVILAVQARPVRKVTPAIRVRRVQPAIPVQRAATPRLSFLQRPRPQVTN